MTFDSGPSFPEMRDQTGATGVRSSGSHCRDHPWTGDRSGLVSPEPRVEKSIELCDVEEGSWWILGRKFYCDSSEGCREVPRVSVRPTWNQCSGPGRSRV